MDDASLIQAALRIAIESPTALDGRASDAFARTIAAQFYSGGDDESYGFVATGSIPDNPRWLWLQLEPDPDFTLPSDRQALGYLAVYLLRHAGRGPVDGWNGLWLRPGEYPVDAPPPGRNGLVMRPGRG
ncbi:hypothetical protein ED92_39235 [Amycolatopsis sp. MJM2582]|nr:hypothetical protein ED92_39235 [Amycolatopsis sp. MJM2582]